MRALLIVNPWATSTTEMRRDVIARALASELAVKVVQTRYRGHARHVAKAAAEAGYGLVITLGGDGTVNEAVNGLLRARRASAGPDHAADAPDPVREHACPAFAALPGGNANVFPQALGMPTDPVDATGCLLDALTSGRSRTVSVGLADDRYFCFNAGLGIDAEVVRAVEGLRAGGRAASTGLYLWTTIHQFFGVTNREEPALTLERDGEPALDNLFCGIVSNTSPWTYLGRRPVNVSPRAGFDTGLDLFALRKMSTVRVLGAFRQTLRRDGKPPSGKHIVSLHDEAAFTFRATRPVAFQVDGEYVGERDRVVFRSVPGALRVIT